MGGTGAEVIRGDVVEKMGIWRGFGIFFLLRVIGNDFCLEDFEEFCVLRFAFCVLWFGFWVPFSGKGRAKQRVIL